MAYTTINKSTDYFNTVLYDGNATARNITTGFRPDWVWLKSRSNADHHQLFDVIRGAEERLYTSLNYAESNNIQALTSFNSDSFSLGTDQYINGSGKTYASWNWKANGAGSSNTDGSISSTVSANTTSGFSIVAWNGNSGTVGHGLGVKPAMIILKSRQSSNNWVVMHKGLTGGMDTNVIVLNTTGAEGGGGSGMAEPTSSVFTITGGLASNDNNIAYCFAEKTGYSKFGSYTGNGNADGTFVYTGFKPAFILVKNTSQSGTNWHLYDNKRLGYNVDNNVVVPNLADAELTNDDVDIVSNGFKFRRATDSNVGSGNTLIYMAVGQSLVGSNNVPCTAR